MKIVTYDGETKLISIITQKEEHFPNGYMKRLKYSIEDDLPHTIEYFDDLRNLHREDGPARIFMNQNHIVGEFYFIAGKLHRLDGPALIHYHRDEQSLIRYGIYDPLGRRSESRCEYYLDGVEYKDKDTIENWKDFCKLLVYK